MNHCKTWEVLNSDFTKTVLKIDEDSNAYLHNAQDMLEKWSRQQDLIKTFIESYNSVRSTDVGEAPNWRYIPEHIKGFNIEKEYKLDQEKMSFSSFHRIVMMMKMYFRSLGNGT